VNVAYATLGGTPDRNDDRVFVTDNAVIVMDGASAFVPCSVDTGTYVDTLGAAIVNELHDQAADLRTAVRNAIATTASKLDLVPGQSPSSTVSIVRIGSETVDVFVLGDTPVILGFTDGTHQRITDDRIHEDGVWCALAQLRPGVGAAGDGNTAEAAINDLREALIVLLAEVGPSPELTLTLDDLHVPAGL